MRAEQKLATRARILNTAKNLIEAQGYDVTTIRKIAEAAGVATGSVFVHFANKEELFYSAFYDELESMIEKAFQQLSEGPECNLEQQLTFVVRYFFETFAGRPRLYQSLLTHSLLSTGEWGGRFRAQVTRVAERLGPLYAQAQARAELRQEIAVPTAIMAFFAFYYFLLLDTTKRGFADIETPLRQFSALLQQHLAGLRPSSYQE